MKKILFLVLLIATSIQAQQIQNQWIWTQGSKNGEENTLEFGVTGEEAATNFPHFTKNGATLTDPQGVIWFMSDENNLWTYNPATNNFNYKKGKFGGSRAYCKGVQIENYRNLPYYAQGTQLWMDNDGNIWSYSGFSSEAMGDQTNKLWKYIKATNNWILIDEGTLNSTGHYDVAGEESPNNKPPAMMNGYTWTDNNNNLWVLGGGLVLGTSKGMWKYNIATGNWTCFPGTSATTQSATYGPIGVESPLTMPAASGLGPGAWKDAQNRLWLFDNRNIWRFNPATSLWTWVKTFPNSTQTESVVTMGTENIGNFPSSVSCYTTKGKALWIDLNGNLWYYYNYNNNERLWKYNPNSNMWTLVKTIPNSFDTGLPIGQFNVADINNTLGPRINAITGVGANGKLYLMGGNLSLETGNPLRDVWEYDINTNMWKWIKGFPYGAESIVNEQKIKYKGVTESENSPGFMNKYTAKWEYNGDLFLFGISGVYNSFSGNITSSAYAGGGIWQFHSAVNKWEYIQGVQERQYLLGIHYDAQGIESVDSYPGSRTGAMSWCDNNGNLWLFGGGTNNDLWKFNKATKLWAWIGGSNTANHLGVYGTQGSYAPTNIPGSRKEGKTWVDSDGDFWLFGGFGLDGTSTTAGVLNDLWKYNVALNQWMWVKGPNIKNQPEVSLGLGISDPTNTPAYNANSVNWANNSGVFWLSNQSAMWKFDIATSNWTKVTNVAGTNYGAIGIPSAVTNPGTISSTSGGNWVDNNGNLLYFSVSLWSFNTTSNLWTRLGGRVPVGFDTTYRYGNYGQLNQAFISNFPGLRTNAASWKDTQGNIYLYGGNGWDEDSQDDMSDVWQSNRNYNLITGTVKVDINNNNCSDSPITVNNTRIDVVDGTNSNFVFTNAQGNYSVLAQSNAVSLTPQNSNYTFTPSSQNFTFSGFGTTQNQNFCATANGILNDLEVIIIPVTSAVIGADVKYKIIYKNAGTSVLSGNIQFNYDDAVMDFVTSSSTPSSQALGTLNWDFTNLNPFETRTILVTLNLNNSLETPPLNLGDVINFSVAVNPVSTDVTPNNNTFNLQQNCIVSYDPNDKTCLEGASVSTQKIGDFVHYIIRFENTGTANATNIVVTDFIDTNKFDIQSIIPLEASHPYSLTVNNNELAFLFQNISLPFPPSNLRYGYVVFKIKTKTTLVFGDTFSNKANIYFDYNSPVITNDYVTTIAVLGLNENDFDNKITLYPNPVKETLYFNTEDNIVKVIIYDINGRVMSANAVNNKNMDVSRLKTGMYLLKIFTDKGIVIGKIIKE